MKVCQQCGVSIVANTKPGKHLELDHPAMERVREYVSNQIMDGQVHPQMVGNFDQVWCVSFRSRPKSLQVSSASRDAHASHLRLRKLRHSMELSLDLPITEELPDAKRGRKLETPTVKGGTVANFGVEGYRLPHTTTTLSWCDRQVGRGFVTIRGDHLGEQKREELNKDGRSVYTVIYIYRLISWKIAVPFAGIGELDLRRCSDATKPLLDKRNNDRVLGRLLGRGLKRRAEYS